MKGKGKRPTRNQKEWIGNTSLNPENWLVRTEDKQYLYLLHRISGKEKKILKKTKAGGKRGRSGRG